MFAAGKQLFVVRDVERAGQHLPGRFGGAAFFGVWGIAAAGRTEATVR